MTFRTATGQTGRDAYLFEASAIANAQRELNERAKHLLITMHDEAPELFYHSTDYHPQLMIDAATHMSGLSVYIKRGECGCQSCEYHRRINQQRRASAKE